MKITNQNLPAWACRGSLHNRGRFQRDALGGLFVAGIMTEYTLPETRGLSVYVSETLHICIANTDGYASDNSNPVVLTALEARELLWVLPQIIAAAEAKGEDAE